MVQLFVAIQVAFVTAPPLTPRARGDRGQATAEYALVLLGAAAEALLLVAWAMKSGKVTDLLDSVIDKILSQLCAGAGASAVRPPSRPRSCCRS
jgi:hypothetical protein